MRTAALERIYLDHLVDTDEEVYARRVSQKYTLGTLERLVLTSRRMTRRGAALAIGLLGDFRSNAPLGKALNDPDRGVRILAESGIRTLWCRSGTPAQQRRLQALLRLNSTHRYPEAIRNASALLVVAPEIAEAWNQRALAHFHLQQYKDSMHDCQQALEYNPYHFGAASGLGQCCLKLGRQQSALEHFQRALQLNPNLEGVRAHILFLRRMLKHE
jgi:tetratricopeptide (TPR) repeat protein